MQITTYLKDLFQIISVVLHSLCWYDIAMFYSDYYHNMLHYEKKISVIYCSMDLFEWILYESII